MAAAAARWTCSIPTAIFEYQLAANGPGPGAGCKTPGGSSRLRLSSARTATTCWSATWRGPATSTFTTRTRAAYLGQLGQPDGAPIAINGLWDLEFGDGMPDSGKTNQLFFDAGPNHPGDATGGLFGVILAAGDQRGNGRSNALPIAVLGQGSGAVLGGVHAPPATSPSPAPAARTPSASAANSSQAVPLASTPPGQELGVPDSRVRDQVFADLEGTQSVAFGRPTDPWTW